MTKLEKFNKISREEVAGRGTIYVVTTTVPYTNFKEVLNKKVLVDSEEIEVLSIEHPARDQYPVGTLIGLIAKRKKK